MRKSKMTSIKTKITLFLAAPKLSEFLNSKSKKVQNIICITLSALFIIDLICCAIFGFNKGEGVGGTL